MSSAGGSAGLVKRGFYVLLTQLGHTGVRQQSLEEKFLRCSAVLESNPSLLGQPRRSVYMFVETAFPPKSPWRSQTVQPCPGLIKSKHWCWSLQRSFTQLPTALSICWIKSSAYPPSVHKAINSTRWICCTTIYIQFEVWENMIYCLKQLVVRGTNGGLTVSPLLKLGPV